MGNIRKKAKGPNPLSVKKKDSYYIQKEKDLNYKKMMAEIKENNNNIKNKDNKDDEEKINKDNIIENINDIKIENINKNNNNMFLKRKRKRKHKKKIN